MSRAAATTPQAPIAVRAADAVLTGLLAGGLLGLPDAEFTRQGLKFREELAPRDLWETLQVDLALLALMMLRRALAALAAAGDEKAERHAERSQKHAHTMLTGALREFAKLRKRPLATPTPATPPAATPPPAPTVPAVAPREPIAAPAPAAAAADPGTRSAVRMLDLKSGTRLDAIGDARPVSRSAAIDSAITLDDLHAVRKRSAAGPAGRSPALA